jgi:hypothetical protein
LVKPSVYIESSVISYLAARPSRDVIAAGRQEEIDRGDAEAAERRRNFVADIPSFAISDEAIELGELLLSEGVVPTGSESDALHIGLAAAQGADFLLTWNFRHINNAEMKAAIAGVVESRGFACPQICSPEELGGSDD